MHWVGRHLLKLDPLRLQGQTTFLEECFNLHQRLKVEALFRQLICGCFPQISDCVDPAGIVYEKVLDEKVLDANWKMGVGDS